MNTEYNHLWRLKNKHGCGWHFRCNKCGFIICIDETYLYGTNKSIMRPDKITINKQTTCDISTNYYKMHELLK